MMPLLKSLLLFSKIKCINALSSATLLQQTFSIRLLVYDVGYLN